MAIAPLKVEFDHAQRRLHHARLASVVDYNSWSQVDYLDVWQEPVYGSIMLRPAPLYAGFYLGAAGIYGRWTKTSYTLTTAAAWTEHHLKFSGDVYLHAIGTNESVITAATLAKNRGVYLSWHAYNAGNDDWVQLECGWNSTASGANGVSLRFWASGLVEVWKDNVMVGVDKLSGGRRKAKTSSGGGQQTAETTTDVILLPWRTRELLVWSNRGDAFSHVFTDIAEGAADPTITAATNFWWEVPSGQATVQAAPLSFASSGYILGDITTFREAPATGETPVYGIAVDDPGYGTTANGVAFVEASDKSTAFSPDGTKTTAYLKVSLTGDGTATDFVWGAYGAFPEQVATTSALAKTDVGDYLLAAQLDVPDSPSDVGLRLELKDPRNCGVSAIESQSNRPVLAQLFDDTSPITIMDGFSEQPQWTMNFVEEAETLEIRVRDRWKTLEQFRFADPFPLDGMALEDAIELVLEHAGVDTSYCDLEATGFDLPQAGGEWNVYVEAGDTAAEWIERLVEDYAATWFYGWVPTDAGVMFWFKSPATIEAQAPVELWDSFDAAVTALQAAPYSMDLADAQELARFRIYNSFQQTVLEPEANDLNVLGWDPRLQRPIHRHYADTASQDPTTAAASRPDNWLGEVRQYGLQDAAITTDDALVRAVDLLKNRLCVARKMVQFEAQLIVLTGNVPLWRGQTVALNGLGAGLYVIESLSCEFRKEPKTGDDWISRPTNYVARYIGVWPEPA